MLGKLARWLRALGFDTLYFRSVSDEELLALARREGRVLLTRDTELSEKAGPDESLFIRDSDWRSQIRQVLDTFGLRDRDAPLFVRCLECNTLLQPLSRSEAKNRVASFVYESSTTFSHCPGCRRVFWRGTHQERMEDTIADILGNG